MVVACGEDAQIVGGLDRSCVRAGAVASCDSVLCDRGLIDIVATFCTNEETLVAERHVDGGDRAALEEVDEGADVDVGLLVVQIELAAVRALGWHVVGEDLGLQALCEVVF